MTGFSRQRGELRCEGASLQDAARAHGTPLYVYSAGAVRAAYQEYAAAFAPVPHRICYALKANGNGALLRLLAGLGAGADIVSGGELLAALRAGFPAERVVFAGVAKSEEEIALGLRHEIAGFNAESEAELGAIAAVAGRLGWRARVALRVNPDIDARSHPYVSTGLRENKFGVDLREAERILHAARRMAALDVVGVQCHIGSQITELAPLGQAARALAALSRRLLDDGFALRTLDVGGGLGIDYGGGQGPSPEELAAHVLPALEELPLLLLLEPGRSLVGRAGALLTRVVNVKHNRGKRFVIVDAGMNDLLRPSLYQAFHRIEPVVPRGEPSGRADVVGPVCETGDFLARDRELESVEPGDLLAVLDAGAYGFVMASNYNMRPRPAELLIDGGAPRLVRRRETFADLVAAELD